MRRGSRQTRWLSVGLLLIAALGLSSCAGSLSWIKDRLPPPHEVEGGILFRFHSPSARQVTLAGDFNNWGGTQGGGRYDPSIDPMTDPDGDGVWEIVVPLPPGRYQYKFVLDGAVRWEADPNNPDGTDDGYGGQNSLLVVPPTVSYGYETVTGTVIGEAKGFDRTSVRKTPADDFVEVTLEADFPDAERVYVAGTFNEWNESDIALGKGEDGVFRTTLKLVPGVYHYKLVVDGTWIADPTNPETIDDGYGGVNSVLTVE